MICPELNLQPHKWWLCPQVTFQRFDRTRIASTNHLHAVIQRQPKVRSYIPTYSSCFITYRSIKILAISIPRQTDLNTNKSRTESNPNKHFDIRTWEASFPYQLEASELNQLPGTVYSLPTVYAWPSIPVNLLLYSTIHTIKSPFLNLCVRSRLSFLRKWESGITNAKDVNSAVSAGPVQWRGYLLTTAT